MRSLVTGLVLIALVAAIVGCEGTGTRTPRPSPSLITLDFSPQPSGTPGASATPGTPQGDWPLGWDAAFCAMFAQAVDAQQLLVDIERALDEGAKRDARLLADELIQSAGAAEEATVDVPEWSAATATVAAIAGLMDVGMSAGTEYHDWFAKGKKGALRRARDLRKENGKQVPAANEGLADLTAAGVACPDWPLVLEAPG